MIRNEFDNFSFKSTTTQKKTINGNDFINFSLILFKKNFWMGANLLMECRLLFVVQFVMKKMLCPDSSKIGNLTSCLVGSFSSKEISFCIVASVMDICQKQLCIKKISQRFEAR